VIVAGVAVWVVFVAVRVRAAATDDRRGLAQVQVARSLLSGSDLLADRPLGPLRAARADFGHAHRLLGSAWLAPARVLPVIGRQLRSVDHLSATAERVTDVGTGTISGAGAALRGGYHDGPQRVAVLLTLSNVTERAGQQLEHLDFGPAAGLIGPVARRRNQLVNEVAKVRAQLATTSVVTGTMGHQLATGAHYLVLESNNAEMRSGSGMFLDAGVLTISNGSLQMGATMHTADLGLPPARVPLSGDLAARWGWLHPTEEWRNLGTTPQFDVTAPLAATMWQAATGQHVDGVLSLDDVALQAMLVATGPVSVGGTTVSHDNAISFLTKDQYLQSDQAVRKEGLGALAQSVVAAIDQGQVSISALASSLGGATAGRHVMLWSGDPAVEAAYRTSGVAGVTDHQGVMVGVLNGGGNKLDPYLDVQVHLSLSRSATATRVAITVDLDNRTPPGLPVYVTGITPIAGVQLGEYSGLLVADIPGAAVNAGIAGFPSLAVNGTEGPQIVLATPFRLLPGQKRQMVVTFDLPGRHGSLLVSPSARVPPVEWTTPGATFTDSRAKLVSY